MKIEQCTGNQIELTLVADSRPRRRLPARPYQRRRQQALWWFREMHRAVDKALGLTGPMSASRQQPDLRLLAER